MIYRIANTSIHECWGNIENMIREKKLEREAGVMSRTCQFAR